MLLPDTDMEYIGLYAKLLSSGHHPPLVCPSTHSSKKMVSSAKINQTNSIIPIQPEQFLTFASKIPVDP